MYRYSPRDIVASDTNVMPRDEYRSQDQHRNADIRNTVTAVSRNYANHIEQENKHPESNIPPGAMIAMGGGRLSTLNVASTVCIVSKDQLQLSIAL